MRMGAEKRTRVPVGSSALGSPRSSPRSTNACAAISPLVAHHAVVDASVSKGRQIAA
jgi:hypothetical protein